MRAVLVCARASLRHGAVPAVGVRLMRDEDMAKAVAKLESDINSLLIDFVNTTVCEIESVTVDTRNFANLKVAVVLRGWVLMSDPDE
jgi:hypothetical protein